MSKKKIYYFDDNISKPVSAGGIIIYKIINCKIYLLLIDNNGNYDDFGGKFDIFNDSDNSIFDAVAKQAHKASNYLLDKNKIKERMLCAVHTYIPHSKYIVYMINATEQEHTSYYNNSMKWVSIRTFLRPIVIKYKVNIRLKHKSFFEMIKKIETDMLEWNIF